MKKNLLSLVAVMIGLSACSSVDVNDDIFAARGRPEALLSASSEKVKYSVEDELALESLASWVAEDTPTRAVISCVDMDEACGAVKALLEENNVPFDVVEGESYQVELVYERVIAKPCDAQFKSNHSNSSNLNHPAFGCANAMNVVQMVGDYRQFTSPERNAPHDAEMAVKNMRRYQGVNDPYYPY